MLARGALGEGAGGAEIGHLERLLQRQTGRHQLAEHALHRGRRQGAGVFLGQPAQHLRLALGAVDVAVLDFADALGQFGATRKFGEQFVIDGVDGIAQLEQFLFFAHLSNLTPCVLQNLA